MTVVIGGDKSAAGPAPPRPSSPAEWMAGAVSRLTLIQVLLIASALRLAVMTIATPIYPDEVYQYLETAHRLVFGQGVVTWDWRVGIRGWLLPDLVALPMAVGGWLAPGTALYRILPNLAMAGASLVTVVFAWRLGARLSRTHAQVAGFVAAIWCELIYFAPHVMSETASAALILPAALILTDRGGWSGRRLALAGALLASAAAIRFQHLPAIGMLLLACCGRQLRQTWRPLLLGGLAGLLPSVVCDASMGAVPFAWLIEIFRAFFDESRAADFSAGGPLGYLAEAWPRWTLWSVPLLLLAGLGARRFPALAWTALANLAAHLAIAHSEYRYLFLSVTLVVVLAAIGTVDWAQQRARSDDGRGGQRRLGLAAATWIIASATCALGGYRHEWTKNRPEMDFYGRLRGDPAFCGLALYQFDAVLHTGGYAYLHRDAPILFFTSLEGGRPQTNLAANAGAFNTILAPQRLGAQLPSDFKALACDADQSDRLCLYRRPGPCVPGAARFTMSTVLQRLNR